MNIEKIKSEKLIQELLKFSIINIDKPSGPTSFQISQYVKNSLNANKTSHFGTLDPIVTGVLPVALGRACRLNDYFITKNKEYVGIMRLHSDISDEILNKEIKKFIGKIKQLPPVRSRVKRAERIREVKDFKILEREGKDVLFLTEVEAGTYIRKLIHDLGLNIGGAHMLELRRIKAGIFEEPSYNLYDFDKAVEEYKKGNEELLRKMLIPAEVISEVLPMVKIRKDVVKKTMTGSPLFDSFLEEKPSLEEGAKICVFCGTNFIGCYKVVNKSTVFAVPEFVFN